MDNASETLEFEELDDPVRLDLLAAIVAPVQQRKELILPKMHRSGYFEFITASPVSYSIGNISSKISLALLTIEHFFLVLYIFSDLSEGHNSEATS